jgi:TonB family protein
MISAVKRSKASHLNLIPDRAAGLESKLSFRLFIISSLSIHLFFLTIFSAVSPGNLQKNSSLSLFLEEDSRETHRFEQDRIKLADNSGALSLQEHYPAGKKAEGIEPDFLPEAEKESGKVEELQAEPDRGGHQLNYAPPPGTGFSMASHWNVIDRELLARRIPERGKSNTRGLSFPEMDGFSDLDYLEELTELIERLWKWPLQAALKGKTGDLFVRLKIARDGSLDSAELLESSNDPNLDQAAIEAIEEGFPFKPLPGEWRKDSLTITAHFVYQK